MRLIFNIEVYYHRWWHGTFLKLSQDSRTLGASLLQMSHLEGRLCSHFSGGDKCTASAE